MERLFVDTSAWFAYANGKDPDHEAVRDVFKKFKGRLTTSNFVFDETVSLCLYRMGHDTARKIGAALVNRKDVDLLRVTPEDEQKAWTLLCKRSDHRYSFTDCTSFELMRRLGLTSALALDDDFRTEGFRALP